MKNTHVFKFDFKTPDGLYENHWRLECDSCHSSGRCPHKVPDECILVKYLDKHVDNLEYKTNANNTIINIKKTTSKADIQHIRSVLRRAVNMYFNSR